MYLGLDYGTANIGLALAERSLATPLTTIDNKNKQKALHTIAKHVKEHAVEVVVCGLPEGPLVPEIKAFATNLKKLTGKKVILHKETLSTQEAVAKLRSLGASKKKLKNDHVYSAVLILEDYLESATLE